MLCMPMDKFWIPLVATLVLLHQSTSSSDTTELIGAVGGSVTFHIQDTSGRDGAVWSFGTEPIVTATFEDPPQVLFSIQTFKTRFAVSEKGRVLSISQLTLEDAGTYSVTIGKQRSTFILHVYREVAEPTVACEAKNCFSDGSCDFCLRCSVSGTDLGNVSYTWRMGDRLWKEGPEVLWVDKSDLEEPLTCITRNPVSSRSVTVTTPNLLCTGTSMPPSRPGSLSGSGITIRVIVGVLVMVLSSVLLLLFCKYKCWRKFCLSQPEPTDTVAGPVTTNTEDGPSRQRDDGTVDSGAVTSV